MRAMHFALKCEFTGDSVRLVGFFAGDDEIRTAELS